MNAKLTNPQRYLLTRIDARERTSGSHALVYNVLNSPDKRMATKLNKLGLIEIGIYQGIAIGRMTLTDAGRRALGLAATPPAAQPSAAPTEKHEPEPGDDDYEPTAEERLLMAQGNVEFLREQLDGQTTKVGRELVSERLLNAEKRLVELTSSQRKLLTHFADGKHHDFRTSNGPKGTTGGDLIALDMGHLIEPDKDAGYGWVISDLGRRALAPAPAPDAPTADALTSDEHVLLRALISEPLPSIYVPFLAPEVEETLSDLVKAGYVKHMPHLGNYMATQSGMNLLSGAK